MKRTSRKHGAQSVKKILFRILGGILIFLLLIVGFFGIKGYMMYRDAVKKTPISKILETVQKKEGFTKYEDLPSIYIEAVIAAEDKRFETHCGIDVLAIARAAWTDLTTLSFAEGGSTITQQIAKNQLFTQEKHIERKVAEIFAAFKLEEEYTKKELFEIYVNTIYFGNGYYGIYDAAQGYFQKEPCSLTDYEAVLLAGLPNAPSVYALNDNMEPAQKRMEVVLHYMIDCGKITVEEAANILTKQIQN